MVVDWIDQARETALKEAMKQRDRGGRGFAVALVLPEGQVVPREVFGSMTAPDFTERLRAGAQESGAVAGVAVIPTYLNIQDGSLGQGSNSLMVVVSGPDGSRASMELVEDHQGRSSCFPCGISFPCDDVVFGGMFQRRKPVKPTLSLLKGKVMANGS